MELQEKFFESEATRWRRMIPWLHLWRVFGIALDVRKVVLGMIGLGVVWSVSIVLPSPDVRSLDRSAEQYDSMVSSGDIGFGISLPQGEMPRQYLQFVAESPSWSDGLHGVICLIVFSIVGVAICRIAAIEFVTGSRGGFLSPVIYSIARLQSSLAAVFIPLAAVAILAGGCWLFGLLFRLPGIGLWLGCGLGWIPYLIGIGMTVMLVGIILGWPLMLASIATDGSDGFDALSRSYNYTYARLGQYLMMSMLSAIGGVISVWIMSFGVMMCSSLMRFILDSNSTDNRQVVTEFWSGMLMVGVSGYVISFVFSSSTIIYFLLRKSVDATPLDVYFKGATDTDSERIPLVGIAERNRAVAKASDEKETEPN